MLTIAACFHDQSNESNDSQSFCLHIERSWPISVSTGLGLGYAISQCERNFNPTLVAKKAIEKK